MRAPSRLVAISSLVLLASIASAVVVETPLRLHASPSDPEAGERVLFRIEPENESVREEWAGATLRVEYSFVENESEAASGVIRDALSLDEAARASFDWTAPAEADDRNVFVTAHRGDELAASTHIGVGDAPPVILAAGGDDDNETDETPRGEGAPGDETPGPALVGLLVSGLVAALLARRRR
ncbi:MAG: hypothetical protein ACT4PT_01430 [Methanobacteriota archaeon]